MMKFSEGDRPLLNLESIDEVNAAFYRRFPYPHQPFRFTYLKDCDFNRLLLNQNIGDWQHLTIPKNPEIWVAGCGTNQAAITALDFRTASVVGSDLSQTSLDVCQRNASAMNIPNLILRRESINAVQYREQFDFIVCTGVIHHNADPELTLCRLVMALKPNGLLELMVYNKYYWMAPSAFQKAVRMLSRSKNIDFDEELLLAKRLMNHFPVRNNLSKFLSGFQSVPDSVLADALTQPMLHSYTIQSLVDMAKRVGLEVLTHCGNMYDCADGMISWETEFADVELQKRYNELSDYQRWELTNLLKMETSPYLWLYLQPVRQNKPRKMAEQLCSEFLLTTFIKASTTRYVYQRTSDATLRLSSKEEIFPMAPPESVLQRIVEAADGITPMGEIIKKEGQSTDFQSVNSLRIRLTTSMFPHLIASPSSV